MDYGIFLLFTGEGVVILGTRKLFAGKVNLELYIIGTKH
jgi:hypothetical protein